MSTESNGNKEFAQHSQNRCSAQVHERFETRVERREKVIALDFVEHVKKEYGVAPIVKQYCELLKDYERAPPPVSKADSS